MNPLIKPNVSLSSHTSWLIGGPAEFFGEPATVDELRVLQDEALKNKWPLTILGGGTNVLIKDQGIQGLVLSLSKLTGVEIVEQKDHLKIWAFSGTSKSELLKIFLKNKLAPARLMAGLPGQVGGGVVMNAGVSENLKPREFCEIVEALEVIRPDGKMERLEASSLKWDYRHCEGWRPGVILRVLLSWPMEADPTLISEVKALNQQRLKKQPLEWPSCGSVFRNPLPHKAGELIEKAGLKGRKVGGAQISEKHANFIINCGGATARDVKTLMDLCISEVREKFSVTLKSEVVFL